MTSLTETVIDKAMRAIAAVLAAGRVKTIASGVENIPARGAALIVARHYHHLFDGLALFAALPRPFHIVVTLDWITDRRTKILMETLNRVARWPIVLRNESIANREKPDALFRADDVRRYQIAALRQSVELLEQYRLLVIFPEGYPNIDPHFTPKKTEDEFLPFKEGFSAIIEAAERRLERPIPLIPAGIRYEFGESSVAYLKFGLPVYRRDFNSRYSLIKLMEREVVRLSGKAGGEAALKTVIVPLDG